MQTLESAGWRVIVVWECELNDVQALGFRLSTELNRIAQDSNESCAQPS
jgi:G:T-mismatch repair DNA endonuclease (very short patch repair protein)